MSPGDFRDYQQRSRSFEMLAAGSGAQVVGATGALTGTGGPPERVDISPVTANFLPLLGVDPVYGRHFTAEDEAVGGPQVVILSYGLWQRRYGGDPAIVGRSIRLDGLDQTVVGVMPSGFHLWLPSEAFLITDSQIWKPLQYQLRAPAAAQLHALHGLRAAEARRHLRAGAGGDVRHRETAARGKPGARGRRHAHPRRPAAGRRRQARAAGDRLAVRGGGLRAADRVRQRRAPAAGPRHGARA